MFKRIATLFAFCAASLFTQVHADNGWGPYVSYWAPADGEEAFGVGAKFGWEVTPAVLWDFRATWYDDMGDDQNYKLDIIPLESALVYQADLTPNTVFSFGGGAGYYLADGALIDESRVTTSVDPDGTIGFFGLLGIEHLINPSSAIDGATASSLFVEVMYRWVEIDDVNIRGVNITPEDASLNGASANIGFLLHW